MHKHRYADRRHLQKMGRLTGEQNVNRLQQKVRRKVFFKTRYELEFLAFFNILFIIVAAFPLVMPTVPVTTGIRFRLVLTLLLILVLDGRFIVLLVVRVVWII